MEIPHITCEHLQKLNANEEKAHVIVDLRDFAEYDAGHIVGSLHVPHKELETNIESLVPDKAKKVIVIVGATERADIEGIHGRLKELGYANVEFLSGGIDAYCEVAPLEIEPELTEQTPEEAGAVAEGDEAAVIDPESHDNEPLL